MLELAFSTIEGMYFVLQDARAYCYSYTVEKDAETEEKELK